MHAVILDIDGTLLASDGADGALYVAAVESVLGRVRLRESWASYGHVTDSGILRDVLRDNGFSIDADIVSRIRGRFFERLGLYIERHGPFSEIPGARDFVSSLCTAADHSCAYATGGWSESALMKLESAGFPIQGVPLSSADDSYERCAIMENALRQIGDCETVTYYGDGAWDREAAARLGWRFVPVGAALGGITRFERRGA